MSHRGNSLDIPSSWRPALDAARAGGRLLLLGQTDTGKSTLAALLANEAHGAGRTTYIVDADVGQSSIGPPACVGLGRVHAEVSSLDDLEPAAIDFVGACSPVRHLLQTATSTAVMTDAARQHGAEAIIIDTTGLVNGGIARALKGAKIRLVAPDFVVALQQEDEVEHLLAPYRTKATPQVLRLHVSRAIKTRAREERAARRQRSFGAYFADASSVELSRDTAPIENGGWTSGEPLPGHMCAYAEERVACEVLHAERLPDGVFLIVRGRPDPAGLRDLEESFDGTARAVDASSLASLLIGLLGDRGQTIAVGILEDVDFRRRHMTVYTPLGDARMVRGVRLGSLHIGRDGTQLGTADVSGE
jgi:polynucleotide 5'-hydroxyl-kinase GRC3/NOL9